MTNHARESSSQSPRSQRASCPPPEQIASLVAAELSPVRGWLVRRHLRACSMCRREHEAEQLLWRDLSLLAASPAPPMLRASILASARARKYLRGESGAPMFRLMLKRRFATALFATVLVGAGSVLAGRLVPTPDASFESGGHRWEYNVNFAGRITLHDTHGRVISTWLSEDIKGDEEIGMDLRVDGQRFFIQVPSGIRSSKELHAPGGELLGTVKMERMPPVQVRALQRQAEADFQTWPYGSQGSDREGASGFHKALGVTWEMRNAQAEVRMLDAAGRLLSTERIRAPRMSSQERAALPPDEVVPQAGEVPEFRIVVRGKVSTARGFGVHPVRDASGRTLLFLEARPLEMASR